MIQTVPGDNLLTLPTLPAQSVQCIITSPPYFGLRDYGVPPSDWPEIRYAPIARMPEVAIPPASCCLGHEDSIEAFIGHLIHVWRLLWRVLRDDGVCWLNIGDAYANDSKWGGSTSGKHVHALHGDSGIGRRRHTTGLRSKNLMLIPQRLALALQADGWIVRQEVIWHKPNGQPENVEDRPTRMHEQIWLLTKQERYCYNADAVREPQTGNAHARGKGITPKGAVADRGTNRANNSFQATTARYTEVPGGRNRRTVWTIPTRGFSGSHFATFPEELVRVCMLAGSQPGDTALDPYGGSGTVGRVAVAHQRAAILCEINESYLDMQAERTNGVQLHMEVA
jgi:DNA modification methylase